MGYDGSKSTWCVVFLSFLIRIVSLPYLQKFLSKYYKQYHFLGHCLSSPLQWYYIFLHLSKLKKFDFSHYKGFDDENIEIEQNIIERDIQCPDNIDFRIPHSIFHKKGLITDTSQKGERGITIDTTLC